MPNNVPDLPESLIDRLHEANRQFHQARLLLDGVEQMSLEQRRHTADVLRAAERELEEVTREINNCLPPGCPPAPAQPPPPA